MPWGKLSIKISPLVLTRLSTHIYSYCVYLILGHRYDTSDTRYCTPCPLTKQMSMGIVTGCLKDFGAGVVKVGGYHKFGSRKTILYILLVFTRLSGFQTFFWGGGGRRFITHWNRSIRCYRGQ